MLRPDLRLVVMSATLGDGLAASVSALLGGCPTLTSEGRCFPVAVSGRVASYFPPAYLRLLFTMRLLYHAST